MLYSHDSLSSSLNTLERGWNVAYPNLVPRVFSFSNMAETGKRGARSIQPKFPEISVQNSMDRFGPTGKVSKKRVHLLRWTTFPGRTGWNFGWMDRAREDPGDEVAANCQKYFFSKWRLRKDLQNCVWLQMVMKVSCNKTSVLACAQFLPIRSNICYERILTG